MYMCLRNSTPQVASLAAVTWKDLASLALIAYEVRLVSALEMLPGFSSACSVQVDCNAVPRLLEAS